MNHKITETLEFARIKGMLAHYLVSAAGHHELERMVPQRDYDRVQQYLTETTDGADILRLEGGIPIPKLADIQLQMKRLKIGANQIGRASCRERV